MTSVEAGPDRAVIGRTGRGLLRRDGDRLVRVIDPRRCDERFRTALAELRGSRPPDALPIVADGPAPDGYHIEYEAPAGFRTLGEAYAEAGHWSHRLALAALVCDALGGWHHGRLATLGLDPHGILIAGEGGRRRLRLAPCPPVRAGTPRELFGLDLASLATLAPELVRGTAPHQRAEDAYALGTLAALALGCRPRRAGEGPAERVERQARDALLDISLPGSEVEPALHPAARLHTLVRTIQLYRNRAADARPTDASALRTALRDAADQPGLAEDLWAAGDPEAGLTALSHAPPGLSMHWLAGRINAAAGRPSAAFEHYAAAVRLSPTQFRLRRQRLDDLWELWSRAGAAPPEWDEALLDDITHVKRLAGRDAEPALWQREALVHERRGDGRAAATTLHEAAERFSSDFKILHLYGTALAGLEPKGDVAAVKAVAYRRLRTLAQIPGMRTEADRWRARFDEL